MADGNHGPQPRPLGPDVIVTTHDGNLDLSYHKVFWGQGLFFFVICAGACSSACAFWLQCAGETWLHAVLGSCAIVGSFGLAVLVLLAAFCKVERVHLGPSGLLYEARVLIPVCRRHIPLDEIC